MASYPGSYLLPNYGFVGAINWPWFGLSLMDFVGSHFIGRHQPRHFNAEQRAAARADGLRIGLSVLRHGSL